MISNQQTKAAGENKILKRIRSRWPDTSCNKVLYVIGTFVIWVEVFFSEHIRISCTLVCRKIKNIQQWLHFIIFMTIINKVTFGSIPILIYYNLFFIILEVFQMSYEFISKAIIRYDI